MLELSTLCVLASTILLVLAVLAYAVGLVRRTGDRVAGRNAVTESSSGEGGSVGEPVAGSAALAHTHHETANGTTGQSSRPHGQVAVLASGDGVDSTAPSPGSGQAPGRAPVEAHWLGTFDLTGGSGRVGGVLAGFGSRLTQVALLLLTVAMISRGIAIGHAPYSNQYEFAVAFAWGMTAAYVFFEMRYRVQLVALAVLPIAIAMLLYARALGGQANPLIPALQNRWLLAVHVAAAVLAYGAAAVACAAAALYLLRPRLNIRGLPSRDTLDELGYRAAITAYPLLTIMLILGAIWADLAWGTYWNWDPKETAALTTWLIYGAYLHARVVRDWRGERAAGLLILGFVSVLFTYFGNLFFGGLHAYA